jgi:hypothetical protein
MSNPVSNPVQTQKTKVLLALMDHAVANGIVDIAQDYVIGSEDQGISWDMFTPESVIEDFDIYVQYLDTE